MRKPKIDFTFLFYTSKNIYLKKKLLFNANLLEKYLIFLNKLFILLRLKKQTCARECFSAIVWLEKLFLPFVDFMPIDKLFLE